MSQSLVATYGGTSIPAVAPDAGEDVTDKTLSLLGLYLKAFINAYGLAAWQAVAPTTLPVKAVFTHDPRKRVFNDRDLPALYLFRVPSKPEQMADGYRVMRSTVTGLWVFPLADQDKQRLRDPFSIGITKLVDAALDREDPTDPCFVITGDSDPKAATYGSDWASVCNADHVWLSAAEPKPLPIAMADGSKSRVYESVELTFTLNEYLVPDFTGATATTAADITFTTSDGAVITAAYSDAIAP